MEKCRWAVAGVLALVLLCSATSSRATDEKAPPDQKAVADSKAGDEAVFDMKEVSLFDEKDAAVTPQSLFGGLNTSLGPQPAKEVKAYPKLNSKQPLYGSVTFSRNPRKRGSTIKFYFVLDESSPAEKPKAEAAKAGWGKPVVNNPPTYHYDRLYFDFNRDLDLTNDAAILPMKEPPPSLARFIGGIQSVVAFNTISVPMGDDPKAKEPMVRALPVALTYGNAGTMAFAAASGRKGEIRLGKRAYSAAPRRARRDARPVVPQHPTHPHAPRRHEAAAFLPLAEHARRHP